MKKLLVIAAAALMFWASSAAACWNVQWRTVIRPGVVHEFVDRDCDGTVDIVQEYVWNGTTWVATGWWWY